MGMQLSDRRTNRSLEKSSKALPRSRLSASTSVTVPHLTSLKMTKHVLENEKITGSSPQTGQINKH